MKKMFITVSMTVFLFLGGCTFLDNVSDTVSYVSEANEYVNEVTIFVKEVPPLAKQTVNDEQALTELGTKLNDMKETMETFNSLEAPDIATDLHQQIVEQNQKAEAGIDSLLINIEEGKLDPEVLENTKVFQTLRDISNIVEQIQQLGF